MLQTQLIRVDLDGVTAGDYIAHAVDADPPIEATRLRSVALDADPLGSEVVAVLRWDGTPPDARTAASVAGLALTQDVAAVRSRVEARPRRASRGTRRPLALAAAL